MTTKNMSVSSIHELTKSTLMQFGADAENAGAVADTVSMAERDGCLSHGLFRLPGYVATLKSGKVNGKARPTVKNLAPAVVQVCLLYTSPSPRDRTRSRMPSSA